MLVAGLRALGAGGVAVGGAGELVAVACQVCAQVVQGGGDPVEAGARAAGGMIAVTAERVSCSWPLAARSAVARC